MTVGEVKPVEGNGELRTETPTLMCLKSQNILEDFCIAGVSKWACGLLRGFNAGSEPLMPQKPVSRLVFPGISNCITFVRPHPPTQSVSAKLMRNTSDPDPYPRTKSSVNQSLIPRSPGATYGLQ